MDSKGAEVKDGQIFEPCKSETGAESLKTERKTMTAKQVKEKGKVKGFYLPEKLIREFEKMMVDLGASKQHGIATLIRMALNDPATHNKFQIELKKA